MSMNSPNKDNNPSFKALLSPWEKPSIEQTQDVMYKMLQFWFLWYVNVQLIERGGGKYHG